MVSAIQRGVLIRREWRKVPVGRHFFVSIPGEGVIRYKKISSSTPNGWRISKLKNLVQRPNNNYKGPKAHEDSSFRVYDTLPGGKRVFLYKRGNIKVSQSGYCAQFYKNPQACDADPICHVTGGPKRPFCRKKGKKKMRQSNLSTNAILNYLPEQNATISKKKTSRYMVNWYEKDYLNPVEEQRKKQHKLMRTIRTIR